jgi:hypothetical protein
MLKQRLISLTATATMVVSATALTTLAATSASANTAATASSHTTAAAAAPGHAAAAAQTCAHIKSTSNQYIDGNGVNARVTADSTGNCFTRPFSFTYHGATGYEYQNGDGHCLWLNGDYLELGAACKANHPNEEFYGVPRSQSKYGGWLVTSVEDGTNPQSFWAPENCQIDGQPVQMLPFDTCGGFWNFPAG